MMQAQEIMSADPRCCTPNDTLEDAAKTMADRDCGCIPIVETSDQRRVVGVLTDRDIALRAVARGRDPRTRIGDVMTTSTICCPADADIVEIEQTMADKQIRRVIIVDDDQCCIGIVSQADVARAAKRHSGVSDQDVGRVVESISEPRRGPSSSPPMA
jgi:CBS domain-containing protein